MRMSVKSIDTTTVGASSSSAFAKSIADQIKVKQLLDANKSHTKQWRKHCLSLIIVSISLIVNFLRGSKHTPSIFGI